MFYELASPSSLHPVEWRDGRVRMLDQRRLPGGEHWIETSSYRDVIEAIGTLAVRGAPLIGIAAAYGVALAARADEDIHRAATELTASRPTAVNLRWAVERVMAASRGDAGPALEEARRIHQEQIDADGRMGVLGAGLIEDGATVLTHCNTGTLATGGIGTALGVIKTAHGQRKRIIVLVDETRPLLQGARLTAWELEREAIRYRVIADSAAAGLIARGDVQAVIVGADRIAVNGDTANKVGSYGLALAAAAHAVPFYVAAPVSTIDAVLADGAAIEIEQRAEEEVLSFAGVRVAPVSAGALNPAFDVTPSRYITAIITERGILRAPYDRSITEVSAELVAR